MDWTNIIIAACSVLATLGGIIAYAGKKFEKISFDLRQLDSRLSRIEGYIERDMVEKYRHPVPTGSE